MRTLSIRTGLAGLILAFFLIRCASPEPAQAIPAIDAYLTDLEQAGAFSGAILIAQDGRVALKKGYGLADRERQIPNTPQTRFRLSLVSMQFTAAAVMMLQSEGLLDVRHGICQYLPECPDSWREVTIHHLLTHTAGIPDTVLPWSGEKAWPATGLERMAQIQAEPLYFQPGSQFRYSHNGYLILGAIIEQVSGLAYADFLSARIFEPLGMVHTGLEGNHLAIGHNPGGTPLPPADVLFRYSAGGLFSSVEDLYRWDQALYNEELLPAEALEQIFTGYATTPSVDFKDTKYGYGWFVGSLLGRRVHAHGGMMSGYSAMILRFPEDRLTLIVLRNIETPIYDRLEIDLARMIFDET